MVMAQPQDENGPNNPQPPSVSKSNQPDKGVGSRPMGPAAENPNTKPSTSNAENDRKPVTPKKLEEQGKTGNH